MSLILTVSSISKMFCDEIINSLILNTYSTLIGKYGLKMPMQFFLLWIKLK